MEHIYQDYVGSPSSLISAYQCKAVGVWEKYINLQQWLIRFIWVRLHCRLNRLSLQTMQF